MLRTHRNRDSHCFFNPLGCAVTSTPLLAITKYERVPRHVAISHLERTAPQQNMSMDRSQRNVIQ